jgi:hypothetical protein
MTSIKDAIKKFEEQLAAVRNVKENYPDKINDYDPLLLEEVNRGCDGPGNYKKVRQSCDSILQKM